MGIKIVGSYKTFNFKAKFVEAATNKFWNFEPSMVSHSYLNPSGDIKITLSSKPPVSKWWDWDTSKVSVAKTDLPGIDVRFVLSSEPIDGRFWNFNPSSIIVGKIDIPQP